MSTYLFSLSLLYKQNNSLLWQAECFQIRPDCECYLVALLMSTGVVGVGPNACKLHSSNDISLVKSNLFTTATTTTTTIKLYSVQVFFQPLCLFSNPFWPRVQHHTHISHFWQTTTFKNSFHQDEQHCRTFTSRRIYWEAWKRYEKERKKWLERNWTGLWFCLDFFVLPTFFDSITAKLWTS